jgi:hypothetical protein
VHRVLGLHRGRGRGEQRRGDRSAGRALERLVLGGAVHSRPGWRHGQLPGRGLLRLDHGLHGCRALPHRHQRLRDAGRDLERHILVPAGHRQSRGAAQSVLDEVSCTSATAGHQETSTGTTETLAEVWNGISWTIQTTPNPSGATDNYLNGVSCTSSTGCSADGYDVTTTYESLAEAWNGTSWALQSSAQP